MRDDVRKLNEDARRLLAFMHAVYMRAGGGLICVGPIEETFRETGLDQERYMAAANRLITKSLAEWFTMGGTVKFTDYGIQVAEDDGMQDYELPVEAV